MPFKKTIEQPDGSEVSHWRLDESQFLHRRQMARFVIAGYRSKALYAAGKIPACTMNMGFDSEIPVDYEVVKGMSPSQIEQYVLTHHPAFAGAISE